MATRRLSTLLALAAALTTACGGVREDPSACDETGACEPGRTCERATNTCWPDAYFPPDAGPPPACASDLECASAACVDGLCACTRDTWESWAGQQFESFCYRCHLWAGSERQVRAMRLGIKPLITSGAMPPRGGLAPELQSRLAKWIDCGAP